MPPEQERFSPPAFQILLTLDGWDVAWNQHPIFKRAETPNLDNLVSNYPCTALNITQNQEALKNNKDQSEIGYYEIGTGEDFFTPRYFIDRSIKNGGFVKNKTLGNAVSHAKKNSASLHLLGSVSGYHNSSSLKYLEKLLLLAQKNNLKQVYLHLILGEKGEENNKGAEKIKQIQQLLSRLKIGEIASLHGRIYALDRNNQWDRVAKTYQALVEGEGRQSRDPEGVIRESYNREIYDQEFLPTVITDQDKPVAKIEEGDSLIFFNIEGDRARELTKAFVIPGWEKFPHRRYLNNLFFVCFSNYEKDLPVKIAFPKIPPVSTLSEVMENQSWSQFKISGAKKYPHLNHFFNGEKNISPQEETRELITSPRGEEIKKQRDITTQIGEKMLKYIKTKPYSFSLVNLADFDLSGMDTNAKEDREQLLQYLEEVDDWIGKISKAVLNKGGMIAITSTSNSTFQKNKESYPVPLVMARKEWKGKTLGWDEPPQDRLDLIQAQGYLKNIYPSILKVFDLTAPKNKAKSLF